MRLVSEKRILRRRMALKDRRHRGGIENALLFHDPCSLFDRLAHRWVSMDGATEVFGAPAEFLLPRGNAADCPHLAAMVKEQITNTGVIPSMASADDGYSTQQGREEVLRLGGQSGKHQRSQRQEDHRGAAMEEPALPTGAGRAQRNRVTGLHFERGLRIRRDGAAHPRERAGRDAGESAGLQYLSAPPGAEEAFRAAEEGTGSGLIKTNYCQ